MKIINCHQQIIDSIISRTRDLLSQGEQIATLAFIGKEGSIIKVIYMKMENATTKNQSTEIVKVWAATFDADFIITLSEAWAVTGKLKDEEIKKICEEGCASHPARMSVIFLTLETYQGYWCGQSVIHELDGKREIDEIKMDSIEKAEGRLTSLLPLRNHSV